MTGCTQYATEPAPLYEEKLVSCQGTYEVQWGDTLGELAQSCGMSIEALATINHIPKPYRIFVGQKIHFHQTPVDLPKPKPLPKGQQGWLWPSSNQSPYEFVKTDAGVEALKIYGQEGDPVYAVADGKVVYEGSAIVNYGNLLMIRDKQGIIAVYAHNAGVLVKEGDLVKAGQVVALLGKTGDVERPTLYFEARQGGKLVDIHRFLKYK